MSTSEPKRPYVYQPYGTISEPDKGDRLYGVAGVSIHADIRGLTKAEAEAVRDALLELAPPEAPQPTSGEEEDR